MCFQEDFFSSLLHKRRAKELKDLIKLFETKKKKKKKGILDKQSGIEGVQTHHCKGNMNTLMSALRTDVLVHVLLNTTNIREIFPNNIWFY